MNTSAPEADSAAPPLTGEPVVEPPAPESAAGGVPSPRAAPPRSVRLGALLAALGALSGFMLMSADAQIPFGPLLGALAMLIAAAGVLELCGLLRAAPEDERLAPRLFDPLPGETPAFAPRITLPSALAIVVLARIFFGPAGLVVPLVVAHLVLLVSALRRPALFVFVVGSLLLLPMLGQYGLWDPWETHYGEVAREILARDDWITLWWAQDEWFRSKPVFIFWIEAFAWGALGIPFGADANPGHPEWAIRLPHYALAMGALMSSYALVARVYGRRAGVVASLVLATTPYFFLLAHQAITDMPFVATMTIALCLFGLAVESEPSARVRTYRIGPLMLSWQSLLLGALVVAALPQALYLISRNLTFITAELGFWPHKDEFLFGSADNSGIPGNPLHRIRGPYLRKIWLQPFAQGIAWLVGLYFVVRAVRRQHDPMTLAMTGFYLFCSFSWMAKGIPGFALPGLIAALYLLGTGRLPLLTEGRLRVGFGILVIAVTGLPWYVAMYGRLGPFFTDRLLIHDHINRLASGVHGDTGAIDYFLTQLGYGMFPWIGIAPLGLAAYRLLRPARDAQGAREQRTAIFIALWMTASFALFNAMITKFHHYIFPAVPPLALLVGLVLERLLGAAPADRRTARLAIATAVLAPLPLVVGAGGLYGNLRGVVPEDVAPSARAAWIADNGLHPALGLLLIALGVALVVETARRLGTLRGGRASVSQAATGAGLLAAAVLTGFAGRDLGWATNQRPEGKERLIGLFVYNYERPFPEHLDYHPVLSGFAIGAFALLALCSVKKLRDAGIYALLAFGFWFSAWALDVYMIDLSPHWSQRELVKRYYEQRASAEEPLIAWQMNWKGENLYTGNRVHVYVDLENTQIEKWMKENAGKRAYFVLEHARLGNFRRMLGARRVDELSTMRENNKFILVRASL